MGDFISEATSKREQYLSMAQSQLRFSNIVIYFLLLVGLFGLGLLNWTDWSFDIELITVAYLIVFGIEIFSYANIIVSMSTNQLLKRKRTSETLYDIEKFNNDVIENYRPEQLSQYVYLDNMKEKRKVFLEKYRFLLSKLEKRYSSEENQREWMTYKKQLDNIKEGDEPSPPSRYCRLKKLYLYKLNNVDDVYKDEHVDYDELDIDDLVIGIGKKGKSRVPRETEGGSLTYGVLRGALVMSIAGILTTVIVINFRSEGWDAIVKTLITFFLVLLSVFKGFMNGERVYEQVTLKKSAFRKKHLHGYCMYEIEHNQFVVLDGHGEEEA